MQLGNYTVLKCIVSKSCKNAMSLQFFESSFSFAFGAVVDSTGSKSQLCQLILLFFFFFCS